MNKRANIYFVLLFTAIFIHQVLQKILHIEIRLIDSFLDPFLGMPLLLYGYLLEKKYLWKRDTKNGLSILEIGIATIIVSFISEYVFPKLSNGFTADIYDTFFFAAGSVFFYFTMNKTDS